MNVPVLAVKRMHLIDVPVPPCDLFEDLCGYRGNKRYIGIYFDPVGEDRVQFIIESGSNGGPASPEPFLVYISHPAIWPELSRYRFGLDGDVIEWLVLDRKTRRLYVGPFSRAIELIVSLAPLPEYPNVCIPTDVNRLKALVEWMENLFP
jgi:hypothetical protein